MDKVDKALVKRLKGMLKNADKYEDSEYNCYYCCFPLLLWCCDLVPLTKSNHNISLPGLFKTDTNRAIKDVQARINTREVKQEDIIGGFCMMNAPFLLHVSSPGTMKTDVNTPSHQEPMIPNPIQSTHPPNP